MRWKQVENHCVRCNRQRYRKTLLSTPYKWKNRGLQRIITLPKISWLTDIVICSQFCIFLSQNLSSSSPCFQAATEDPSTSDEWELRNCLLSPTCWSELGHPELQMVGGMIGPGIETKSPKGTDWFIIPNSLPLKIRCSYYTEQNKYATWF